MAISSHICESNGQKEMPISFLLMTDAVDIMLSIYWPFLSCLLPSWGAHFHMWDFNTLSRMQ